MNIFNHTNVNKNKFIQNTIIKQEKSNNHLQKNASEKNTKLLSAAAGIGVTALIIGGILYKKNLDSTSIKQLNKNIEFKHCETLEEALNFGKNILGVKKYNGFEERDLDVINWINEGLVNVNNAAKGKATMPRSINYKELILNGDGENNVVAQMNAIGDMNISKKFVDNIKSQIKRYIKGTNVEKELIEKLNYIQNFFVWVRSYIKILKKYPDIADIEIRKCHFSPFSTIYHEMGHLQHAVNTKTDLPTLKKIHQEQFLKSIDIAKNISEYAAKSPNEFVAECFAKMVDGQKLDDKTMELYKKLGGFLFDIKS